jgi:hypothetical protein
LIALSGPIRIFRRLRFVPLSRTTKAEIAGMAIYRQRAYRRFIRKEIIHDLSLAGTFIA